MNRKRVPKANDSFSVPEKLKRKRSRGVQKGKKKIEAADKYSSDSAWETVSDPRIENSKDACKSTKGCPDVWPDREVMRSSCMPYSDDDDYQIINKPIFLDDLNIDSISPPIAASTFIEDVNLKNLQHKGGSKCEIKTSEAQPKRKMSSPLITDSDDDLSEIINRNLFPDKTNPEAILRGKGRKLLEKESVPYAEVIGTRSGVGDVNALEENCHNEKNAETIPQEEQIPFPDAIELSESLSNPEKAGKEQKSNDSKIQSAKNSVKSSRSHLSRQENSDSSVLENKHTHSRNVKAKKVSLCPLRKRRKGQMFYSAAQCGKLPGVDYSKLTICPLAYIREWPETP